jgi:uncharacterized lipoprotein NlpE involved in copper resistance
VCLCGQLRRGGNYTDASRNFHAFIVAEKDGVWGNAEDIPGITALSTVTGKSAARSVSCGAPGDCALIGYYPDSSNVTHAFVTEEAADGTWNPARQFGPASTGSMATSVSCSSAGNCGAERAGFAAGIRRLLRRWRPGDMDLSPGTWWLSAVYHGDGAFTSASSASQVLTVTRATSSTRLTLSRTTVSYGHENSETLSVADSSGIPGWLPAGRVTIKAGKTTLCAITLSVSTGKGSCRLSSTRLRAGAYQLVAFYSGDAFFTPSSSAPETLRITG